MGVAFREFRGYRVFGLELAFQGVGFSVSGLQSVWALDRK